jgi:hypothetical protein
MEVELETQFELRRHALQSPELTAHGGVGSSECEVTFAF